jgi:hypothetical protein
VVPRVALCLLLTGASVIALTSRSDGGVHAQADERPRLSVMPTDDFEISGTGEHGGWRQPEWTALRRRQPDGLPYDSRFKMLYDRERRTRKATSVLGGPKQSQASIQGWRAEFFIPYALLTPLQNVPPKPGTIWRANFYRMDYDGEKVSQWEWARVGNGFHEYEKFGQLVFANR